MQRKARIQLTREPVVHDNGIPVEWMVTVPTGEITYRAFSHPVDVDLIEPLGWVTFAGIRFHSTLRSLWTFQLNGSDTAAHEFTLGKLAAQVVARARSECDPRAPALEQWHASYGKPAIAMRNGVLHSVPYTAEDQKQALSFGPAAAPPIRLTREILANVAGVIGVADSRLDDIRMQGMTTNGETHRV